MVIKGKRREVPKGFPVGCIRCSRAWVRVSLADTAEFYCGACNSRFTTEDVRLLIAQWTPILEWLESAPFQD